MKEQLILKLVKEIYQKMIRKFLWEKVEDSENELDDFLLTVFDRLLGLERTG